MMFFKDHIVKNISSRIMMFFKDHIAKNISLPINGRIMLTADSDGAQEIASQFRSLSTNVKLDVISNNNLLGISHPYNTVIAICNAASEQQEKKFSEALVQLDALLKILPRLLSQNGDFFCIIPFLLEAQEKYKIFFEDHGLFLDSCEYSKFNEDELYIYRSHIFEPNFYKISYGPNSESLAARNISDVSSSDVSSTDTRKFIKKFFTERHENPYNQWEWQAARLGSLSSFLSILEIGSGDGILWKYKASELSSAHTVFLTDITDKKKLECLSYFNFPNTTNQPTVSFGIMDVDNISLEEANKYDLIIAHSVLFLSKDPKEAISSLYRLLRVGGTLSMSIFMGGGLLLIYLK